MSLVFYSLDMELGITFTDESYFQERENIVIGNDAWTGLNFNNSKA